MKIKLLLATLFFPFLFLNAQVEHSQLLSELEGLEKDIEKTIAAYHAAGLAVAIIKGDQTIFTKGYGYRDFEEKKSVDGNTVFGIGSVTKSFTASLLGILSGQSKLKLTDRPSEYIPELKFFNSSMDDAIQIRNLLCHNTGLSNMSSESSCIFFQSSNTSDLIPRLKYLKPSANVGERFMYSNYMYSVASIVSERVTGASWATNLSTMIFNPLQLNHTFSGIIDAKKNTEFAHGYAVHNNKPTRVVPQNIPTLAAAGEIFSSVNDMAKWVTTWMNNGQYNGKEILPTDYIDAAIRPQQIMVGRPTARHSDTTQFANYGYGWMNSSYKGYYRVEHSGAVSGYTSNVVFFPVEKIGVVVLSNQSNSNISYTVTDLLLEKLLDIEPSTERTPDLRYSDVYVIESTPSATILNEEEKPSNPLSELAGNYSAQGYGKFEVKYENGILYADLPFTRLRLSHEAGNEFNSHFTEKIPQIMLGGSWLRFTFLTDEDAGYISGLIVNMDEGGVPFSRDY